ncbi:hypothetical protein Salat_2847800 [Sesamum alatum]|uniref:Uncharacterized protein n=1 Tax=Sesamum alatum TaxID=300844 RepID=A0AAE2C9U8_9LAMI|nr:hypothetical protein Salat_2847800 [Sesamum alatum]
MKACLGAPSFPRSLGWGLSGPQGRLAEGASISRFPGGSCNWVSLFGTRIRSLMETEIKHLGWALRLTEDEGNGLRNSDELWEESPDDGHLFLVRRLLVNRDVHFEGFVDPGENTPYGSWLRAPPGSRVVRRLEPE